LVQLRFTSKTISFGLGSKKTFFVGEAETLLMNHLAKIVSSYREEKNEMTIIPFSFFFHFLSLFFLFLLSSFFSTRAFLLLSSDARPRAPQWPYPHAGRWPRLHLRSSHPKPSTGSRALLGDRTPASPKSSTSVLDRAPTPSRLKPMTLFI
jgi:hypothetical protein